MTERTTANVHTSNSDQRRFFQDSDMRDPLIEVYDYLQKAYTPFVKPPGQGLNPLLYKLSTEIERGSVPIVSNEVVSVESHRRK